MTEYFKASPTTDALDTLGSIITPSEKRDAIHLAVEPVEAAHKLYAGMDVKLVNGRAERVYNESEGVGIVDPFLKTPVHVGERFWLVVYPRQISSLRHVWEHPSFPASGETDKVDNLTHAPAVAPEDESERLLSTLRKSSEEWLRRWCDGNDIGFDELIDMIDEQYGTGYMTRYGQDFWAQLDDTFWQHVSVYKGSIYTVAEGGSTLGCSC